MLSFDTDTNKLKQRLSIAAFEAGLIVLGVFLGFLANQWHISEVHETKAESALRAIRVELQSNYRQVKNVLPYHRRLDSTFSVLIKNIYTNNSKVTAIEFRKAMPKGFEIPSLQKNAWELANRTGATNYIDFELVSDLSELYSLQAFLKGKLDATSKNWYVAGNINPNNFSATAIVTGILAGDIVKQEEDLVEKYPKMIERIKNANP